MSAVGASYVAIYHQTTQQISAHTQKRFRNCSGHGHKGGTHDSVSLPALPFCSSESPTQTRKIDILSGRCKL